MLLAIQVFIIVAAVLLLGLLISLILRSIKLFLNIILPLVLLGLLIRLAKDVLGWIPSIGRSTILLVLGGLAAIGILIRLVKNLTGIFASILSRIFAILIGLFLVTWLFKSGIVNSIIDRFDDIFDPSPPPVQTGDNNTGYNEPPPIPIIGMSCELPRGGLLPDSFYVFAYKNRRDSPSICDIEIRLCEDGILAGTNEQPYCYPLLDDQVTVIPFDPDHEDQQVNPLIQPGPTPYKNALFDTDGKRITKQLPPIQIPDIQVPITKESQQSYILQKYCISPRGELIKPGQFTKAYFLPTGTKDEPCLPELRLCTNGKLLGNFLYPTCELSQW